MFCPSPPPTNHPMRITVWRCDALFRTHSHSALFGRCLCKCVCKCYKNMLHVVATYNIVEQHTLDSNCGPERSKHLLWSAMRCVCLCAKRYRKFPHWVLLFCWPACACCECVIDFMVGPENGIDSPVNYIIMIYYSLGCESTPSTKSKSTTSTTWHTNT